MRTHELRSAKLVLSSCLLATVASGCQKPSGEGGATDARVAASAGGERTNAVSNRARAAKAGSPEDAVKKFLSAFRKQDDAAARRMLTPAAREQTKEMDLNKDLQVSDKAAFQIGEVEVLEDQGRAHVQCTWTDIDADSGEKYSSDMVWVCQLEDEGWRIKGLGIRVFPDAEGVILDYENPEEMAATMEAIDQEIARRASLAEQDRQAAAEDPADGGADARPAGRASGGDVRTASRGKRDASLDADRESGRSDADSSRDADRIEPRSASRFDRAAPGRGDSERSGGNRRPDRVSESRDDRDRDAGFRSDDFEDRPPRDSRRGFRQADDDEPAEFRANTTKSKRK